MALKIDENYSLKVDRFCWILEYKSVRNEPQKDGSTKKVTTEYQTYHATLPQAMIRYMDSCMKSAESIKQLQDKMTAAMVRIETACGDIRRSGLSVLKEDADTDKSKDEDRDIPDMPCTEALPEELEVDDLL